MLTPPPVWPPFSRTPPGFTAECVRLDNHLRLNRAEKSGSTAAVALVTGTTLVTANIGDSTILLVKGDGSVVVLSAQHNTLDEGELARLQAEGARLRAFPKQGAPGGVMHRIYDAAGVQGLMCSRWVTGGTTGVFRCVFCGGGGGKRGETNRHSGTHFCCCCCCPHQQGGCPAEPASTPCVMYL
jgi:hypothetical protein